MYQLKTDDNPKILGALPLDTGKWKLTAPNPSTSNHVITVGGGTGQGVGRQFVYDTDFRNALLTVEMRLTDFSDSASYVPFVHTYIATAPVTEMTNITVNSALLHTLGSATQYATQGKVIVPKLSKNDVDDVQYVVVGYISDTVNLDEIQIQSKLYLDEYAMAQPTK